MTHKAYVKTLKWKAILALPTEKQIALLRWLLRCHNIRSRIIYSPEWTDWCVANYRAVERICKQQGMVDYVDARDSRWYHDWCERDGSFEELTAKYIQLGGY